MHQARRALAERTLNFLRAMALFLVASCSPYVEPVPGPFLDCQAVECPPLAEVERVMSVFRDQAATTFNPHERLEILWLPPNADLGTSPDGGRIIGLTTTPHAITTTSMRVLVHELMHVHLWREFPASRGDADHESGTGPWTDATNEAIREVAQEAGY